MAKYKICVPDFQLKEVHLCAENSYHRVVFENGVAYTDSEGVADFFRSGRRKMRDHFGVWEGNWEVNCD